MAPEKLLTDLLKSIEPDGEVRSALLPASGSDRQYFRMMLPGTTYIGAYNPNRRENDAFVYMSRFFEEAGMPVPHVFAYDPANFVYLQEDLGNETLYDRLSTEGFSDEVKNLYRKVISWLIRFQLAGKDGFDYANTYPRQAFDRQSMTWDLNYFKYYFARLSGIEFDEQALEDDFQRLMDFLQQAPANYFMYRDFQSRNIMVQNGSVSFVDFQGGRQGPLQYDLASLLYDAKADMPEYFRRELTGLYKEEIAGLAPEAMDDFDGLFRGFVLIRILQALGTYGFRGFYQKKEHFLLSIPYALNNLDLLLPELPETLHVPELTRLLRSLGESEVIQQISKPVLNIKLSSFSYKAGIPEDTSGHGGGFVFDCRALPNPGREPEFAAKSGNDAVVADYLNRMPQTAVFLNNVYGIVDQAVENYRERGFRHLMVSFGCTGGQHRSVFCANELSKHLKKRYNINAEPIHTQQNNWRKE